VAAFARLSGAKSGFWRNINWAISLAFSEQVSSDIPSFLIKIAIRELTSFSLVNQSRNLSFKFTIIEFLFCG